MQVEANHVSSGHLIDQTEHKEKTCINGNNSNHMTMNGNATTSTTTATTPMTSKVHTGTTSNDIQQRVDDDDDKSTPKEGRRTYDTLKRWYKLLFTKEDYLHHHKTLGILCLLSFILRFVNFFNQDMAFQAYPHFTIPTIVLHTLLSVSSFQFKIPIRRIRDGGRIWPQYRWHSLIFSLRSLLLLALYYYEDLYQLKQPLYYMNYIVLLCIMGAAELVNTLVGEEQRSNTVREIDGSGYAKFFFSAMQYNAWAVFLIGIRCYSIPFYALFTIQITPFIGTLRRKMIFTSNFWGAFVYGAMLVGGFSVQTYYYHTVGGETFHLFGRSIGFFAALLRFTAILPKSLSFLQNKFVIWTLMYYIIQRYRAINFDMDVVHLRIVFGTIVLLLSLTAHHKVQSGYYPKDVKHAKQIKMSEKSS
jgi:hypothetical protein